MMSSLLKAAVGLVIETPIAVVADFITMGGALTDQPSPYTAQAARRIVQNVKAATEPDGERHVR